MLGADGMNEVSINLSSSSVMEGADPKHLFNGRILWLYMIVGLTVRPWF